MKPIRRIKCSKTRLRKIFLILLLVTAIQILSSFLRDSMIRIRLSLAITGNYDISLGTQSTATAYLYSNYGSSESLPDRILEAVDEREGKNISHASDTGCGWTKMTLLEDQDDRLRYQHNEGHLGSGIKQEVVTRTALLGLPHSGAELLSHLLLGYPASLLVSDPLLPVTPTNQDEDEVRTSRKLSWLLDRIFCCDLSIINSLPHRMASTTMIDNILVTLLYSRLSSLLWWQSRAPQVQIIHLVRNPRSLLAEQLARDDLDSISNNQEDIRRKLSSICQDFREDVSASHSLNTARYIRVKYEDLLESPTNITLGLLERLHLPRHQEILSLLDRVENIQLDQVSEWTGDIREDLGSQIAKERLATDSQLWVPNINLEADFISNYVNNETEDLLREECEDVMMSLGYNFI